jgi:lycopene cyclase domain-containing protein
MMTYFVLNIIFVVVTCLLFRIKVVKPTRRAIAAAVVLFVLTILFDSLLIYFDIIDYSTGRILGLRIGLAPIEDYFYPFLALLLIPRLWKKFGKKHV